MLWAIDTPSGIGTAHCPLVPNPSEATPLHDVAATTATLPSYDWAAAAPHSPVGLVPEFGFHFHRRTCLPAVGCHHTVGITCNRKSLICSLIFPSVCSSHMKIWWKVLLSVLNALEFCVVILFFLINYFLCCVYLSTPLVSTPREEKPWGLH